jgi:hypothetical protein
MDNHTIRNGVRLASAAALLILGGCGGGPSVRTHYDPAGISISAGYESFAWLAPSPGASPRTTPEGMEATVLLAMESALVAKGYALIPLAPHFRMGWHYTTEPTDITAIYHYYSYTWGRWFPGGGVNFSGDYLTELPAGALVLDAVDASTNELTWRSIAQIELAEDPAGRARQLTETINGMIARFPRP